MAEAQIIDGKALALTIRTELSKKVAAIPLKPNLAVVLVGNDEASLIYDRNKQKAAQAMGMDCEIYHLPENVAEYELLELISQLNNDTRVNGVLVQLPLPKHINTQNVLMQINPEKDVDGFNPYNVGLLQANSPKAMVPATPKGVLYILKHFCSDLSGKYAVIIGRSNIVGKPMAALLLNQNCTVTIVHSKTQNIEKIVQQADIVIAACGKPQVVKADWIKDGAFVIDVGINRVDGKIYGDVDFENVCKKASYITPVPGGVGPMTIAMLLENTFDAFIRQNHFDV